MSGGTVFFTYGCLPWPSWWNMPPMAKNSCWPDLGRLGQADVVDPDAVAGGDQAALLAAQPAGAVPADRDHPAARRARPGRVGVPPRLASRAQPPVGAGHAPPAAVRAGADQDLGACGLPGGRSLAGARVWQRAHSPEV